MPLTLEMSTIDQLRAGGLEDMLALQHDENEDQRYPMAIDWQAYYGLERAGVFKPLALRLDGELIGYALWFLKPLLHSRDVLWAVCDVLYVEPEHRGYPGAFLIRRSERLLRQMGARVLLITTKPRKARGALAFKRGRDSVGHLLSRLRYAPFEEAWVKYV